MKTAIDNFTVSEDCGALVSFHGTTRNTAKDGKEVVKLDYSCYPQMAMKQLANIANDVIDKHNIKRIAIHHSIGSVPPREAGVLSKFYKIFNIHF